MSEPYAKIDDPSVDAELAGLYESRDSSRGCENCAGSGFASIFDPRYRGIPYELFNGRNVLLRTVAFCVCNAGRWVYYNYQKRNAEAFRRMPDLHDVIAGRTRWQLQDPRPTIKALPRDLVIVPHWRKIVKRLADELHSKPAPRPQPKGDPILQAAEEESVPF